MHDEDELGDVIVVVPVEEGPLGLAVDKVVAVVTQRVACRGRVRAADRLAGVRPRGPADRRRRPAGVPGGPAGRWPGSLPLPAPAHAARLTPSTCRAAASDVALEDARLRQPGQPLAHGAGAALADALDGLQVVDARREQPSAVRRSDRPAGRRRGWAAAAPWPGAGSRAG